MEIINKFVFLHMPFICFYWMLFSFFLWDPLDCAVLILITVSLYHCHSVAHWFCSSGHHECPHCETCCYCFWHIEYAMGSLPGSAMQADTLSSLFGSLRGAEESNPGQMCARQTPYPLCYHSSPLILICCRIQFAMICYGFIHWCSTVALVWKISGNISICFHYSCNFAFLGTLIK